MQKFQVKMILGLYSLSYGNSACLESVWLG